MQKENNFIWTDLSTYFPNKSWKFYKKVFDWEMVDADGYWVIMKDGEEIGGMYETPEFFQRIKMPHFWMNYIAIDNLETTVNLAVSLGAKIEMKEAEFYEGRIALIRDPLGAGFTVYEGNKLKQTTARVNGSVMTRELHCSDLDKVRVFYTQLFNWQLDPVSSTESRILNSRGEELGLIRELDNSIKGKFEYWASVFGVEDMERTRAKVIRKGGTEVFDEGDKVMLADRFGSAFFYLRENMKTNFKEHPTIKTSLKWLREGMVEYMPHASYKNSDVEQCMKIVHQYLEQIERSTSKEEGMEIVKKTILQLNELNDKLKGQLIETDQREELAEIIIVASSLKGYNNREDDITEEWREW